MRCSACSSPLPENARFCPACGEPSTTPAGLTDATRTLVGRAPATPSGGAFATAPEQGRFQTGTVLADRYRIVGLLGRGGMGEVYRADDLKLGRVVALKFLPEAMERDPGRQVRFFNEVRTALRVTHPNVCRVYDLGDTGGRHFLSMEYVDGEDLATLLRRIGRLPEERAVQVARQLCAGLAAAHSQGVLHRDLKPANVMIDGRGEVKIADFGLAGAAGEFAGDEIRAGTPAYMAPEQLEGREVTSRSDLYSLGLVLYELFSGKPAFGGGRTPPEVTAGRRATPTRLSSLVGGLDPAVAQIVDRCLAIEPADRPASAEAIAAALPGGDPLAAALAAGVTPSPELVAEAGASTGLRPRVAVAILLTIFVTMAVVAAVAARALLVGRAALDLSPPVLSNKAWELIREAGWHDGVQDHLQGWIPNWPYYRHLRESPAAAGKWEPFARLQPPGMLFAYRASPQPLVQMSKGSVGDWWVDPAATVAGMVEVRLDATGRLFALEAVPVRFEPVDEEGDGRRDPSGAGPDLAAFFRAAGLDLAAFEEAEPTLRPAVFADRRFAWSGRYPDAPEVDIRVEAASLAGRLVSFRIVEPWDRPFLERPTPPTFWERIGNVVRSLWFVAVILGGAAVAIRNVRLGRGDHRTAFRFGVYLAAARLLWMLDAHHSSSPPEILLLTGHIAWAAYRFVLVYVFYLALEPYARRLWPEMLVSWVRLFGGRFRDPRVGRDVLIGVVAGCFLALVQLVATWLPQLLGLRDYGLLTSLWSWESLRGVGPAFAMLAGAHVEAVVEFFVASMLFLVVRVITRRTWIAVTVVSGLGVVMFNPGIGTPWPYLTATALAFLVYWAALFRAGLLSVMVMATVAQFFLSARATASLTAWHALPMWIAYGTIAAVALWAFRAAVAGQPLFRDEIQDAARGSAR